MKLCRCVVLLGASLGLSGCSSMFWPGNWFDEAEDAPAELVEFAPEIDVSVLWKADVGGGAEGQRVNLVPAVYGGVVYAVDREGMVEAVDSESGASRWKVELDIPVSSGPGVGEDLLLLGTSDAQVVAIERAGGAERWRAKVTNEVLAVPQVDQGIVVAQTIDGKVLGLDAWSGTERWRHEQSEPTLSLRGTSSPTISGPLVICGFANGKLVALELSTGRTLWETPVAVPKGRSELDRLIDIDSDPFVTSGLIFANAFHGELAAVAENNGQVLWKRPLSAHSGITADRRKLYITDTQDTVWAVDPRNGAAVWKQEQLARRRISGPTVVGEYLVVGDFEGYLHWMSVDDGRFVARNRLGSAPISVPPKVVWDRIYVYGEDGDLAAMRPGAADL